MHKKEGKVRIILLNVIRALLIVALLTGLLQERRLVLAMAILGLAVTIIPSLLSKYTKIRIPAQTDVIIILFIYGALYFGNVRGLYGNESLIGALLSFATAIILGLVGLTVLHALYQEKKLSANPTIFAVFAFCFALSIGALWELFEFGMDSFFGFKLQRGGLSDAMTDLLFNSLGAFTIALGGYFYVKKGRTYILSSKLVERLVTKHKRVFSDREKKTTPADDVKNMIQKGEHKQLEFKSSLRTNLHTKQTDKRMEHAVLKTVNAYLNTEGGTLLVGIGDKGEIIGTDHDQFPTTDALNLYVTNMLKNNIGAEFLPFIDYETLSIDGKNVLKIDCSRSHKEVFLKNNGQEEFYVRNGPSSALLSGRALVDYIHHQFRTK